MHKQLLFGTTNPTRFLHVRTLLEPLPIQLLSLQDLGVTFLVSEDGTTPAENATIKAQAYFAATEVPTLAIDAGLTLDALPAEKQPGVFVRRIHQAAKEASDAEMLAYYQEALDAVGGSSVGQWHVASVLVSAVDRVICDTFTVETYFTAIPSPIRLPGEPLNSLQFDRQSGRYFSELSPKERNALQTLRTQRLFRFVQRYLKTE